MKKKLNRGPIIVDVRIGDMNEIMQIAQDFRKLDDAVCLLGGYANKNSQNRQPTIMKSFNNEDVDWHLEVLFRNVIELKEEYQRLKQENLELKESIKKLNR